MKKLTKNDVKTWIATNKKKLIIGGSVIAGGLTVYFTGKMLLNDDKVLRKMVSWANRRHLEITNKCCIVDAAWVKKGITDEQVDAIMSEAFKKLEDIYRASGVIK